MLSPPKTAASKAPKPAPPAVLPAGESDPLPSIADVSTLDKAGDGAAPPASAGPAKGADEVKAAVMASIEADGTAAAGGAAAESLVVVPDTMLLDEPTKAEIARRARIIADMGAIRPLVLLCDGPDGPLPDLEAGAGMSMGDAVKKKGTKDKKKGKGKMEPGVAEAQVFSTAVLRLISLDDAWRVPLAQAGVVR